MQVYGHMRMTEMHESERMNHEELKTQARVEAKEKWSGYWDIILA